MKRYLLSLLLTSLLLTSGAQAASEESDPNTYHRLTVKGLLHPFVALNVLSADEDFVRKSCELFENSKQSRISDIPLVKCYQRKSLSREKWAKKHSFLIEAKPLNNDALDLAIIYLDGDELDLDRFTIQTPKLNDSKTIELIDNTLRSLIEYHAFSDQFRRNMLRKIPPSEQSAIVSESAQHRDRALKDELALQDVHESDPPRTNALRAALELSVFMGIGIFSYASDDEMKQDWDYVNTTPGDFARRIFTTDQMAFDNNSVFLNWGHTYAGAYYYQVARENGFDTMESFLINIASSSFWEYIVEYRELVSINDQIMTGVGGAVMGEALYQMADMLSQKPSSFLNKTMITYLKPAHLVHGAVDKTGIKKLRHGFKQSGFRRDNFQRFDLLSGVRYSGNRPRERPRHTFDIAFDGEVVHHPIHTQGETTRMVIRTTAAEVAQRLSVTDNGIEDFHAYSKISFTNLLTKNIRLDRRGRRNGYSFFAGPAMGIEYNSRGKQHTHDFYAFTDILGASVDTSMFSRDILLRVAAGLYGNFTMVRPAAINSYFDNGYTFEQTKSELRSHNYYFATGFSFRARVEASYRNWSLGSKFSHHNWDSIDANSLDRHPDQLTIDLKLHDHRTLIEAWASYDISERLGLTLFYDRLIAEGTIKTTGGIQDDVSAREIENIYRVGIKYDFL
jgi:hypothetical protein